MYCRPFQPVVHYDLIDREFELKMAELAAELQKAREFLATREAGKVRKAQELLERKGASRKRKSRKAPVAPKEPEGPGTFGALPMCLGMATVVS